MSLADATPQTDHILRYDNGAVFLHWLTALIVVVQVVIGFVFSFMERSPARTEWFAWHKTLGAAILILAVVRLLWRLAHKPPPFPDTLPQWERIAAIWSHRAFYLLLVLLPLTGLIAVSGHSTEATTDLVGGLRLPVVPGVPKETGELSGNVHVILVLVTLALVLLHIAAALYHQFGARTRAEGRMPPFRERDGTPVVPAH